MTVTLSQALFDKHKQLFFNEEDLLWDPEGAPTHFDFAVGDGWYDLLDKLLSELEETRIVSISNPEGALYVKVSSCSDSDEVKLALSQVASTFVCEMCGEPGEFRGSGMAMIRCDNCFANACSKEATKAHWLTNKRKYEGT